MTRPSLATSGDSNGWRAFMAAVEAVATRLRDTRRRRHLTQDELAAKAGVGVATIRRMEAEKFDPRLSTATKLADALRVRVEWLLTEVNGIVALHPITGEQQHKEQSGPGTEGLPGYVIGGPGPWFTDDNGEWRVDTGE